MYPNHIPQFVRDDPARDAECDVYEALRDGLSDEWIVFGWVAWVLRRRVDGAAQGEADFLLVHAQHGLVVLEVKGGLIAFDAASSRWTSTSMSGVTHDIQDPLEQAHRNRRAIETKLRETPGWAGDGIPFAYAAAFPDCKTPSEAVRPNAPREILLDYGDLGMVADRLQQVVRFWRRPEASLPLGEHGVSTVIQALASSFSLRMPLGRAIAEGARRFVTLTDRQFQVLDGLARNRRVVISGGAGTGKTLLALEKAKRLARDHGFKTLLTCFNLPLAAYLRASSEGIPNLTVMNFHELCADFSRHAGQPLADLDSPGLPNDFFRRELPARLVDAVATTEERFEAIVVDEGQDFSPDDRAALELVLEERGASVLYVFQDGTQAIYREATPWPESGMAVYELTENRRNTRSINQVISRLHDGAPTVSLGPEGREPEFVPASSPASQAREVSRALHRLIREECVLPSGIAVLVSSRRSIPELVIDGRIGAFPITRNHSDGGERVLVESVTRFKGLERDVIVLVRLDPVEYCEFQPLLHVGASRARQHLVVIGDDALLARFRGLPPLKGD